MRGEFIRQILRPVVIIFYCSASSGRVSALMIGPKLAEQLPITIDKAGRADKI